MAASDNDFQLPAGRFLSGCPTSPTASIPGALKTNAEARPPAPTNNSRRVTPTWPPASRGLDSRLLCIRSAADGQSIHWPQAKPWRLFCESLPGKCLWALLHQRECLYCPRCLGEGAGASWELLWHERHGRSSSSGPRWITNLLSLENRALISTPIKINLMFALFKRD